MKTKSTDCHARLQYAMPLHAITTPQMPERERAMSPVMVRSFAMMFLNI